MKFNSKTRYGIRTMVEIAIHNDMGGILQKDIADHQDISVKYLDQIIHSLKIAGLVIKNNEKKRKYILTRSASKITIYDIYKAFESEMAVVECLSQFEYNCKRIATCRTICFWNSLNSKIKHHFQSSTLADLIDPNTTFN